MFYRMDRIECAVCLGDPVDPQIIPECEHFFCRACLDQLKPNDGQLLCPLCRRAFSRNDVRPYKLEAEMSYCLDLTCQPGSGCTKLHIDDLCPNLEEIKPVQVPIEAIVKPEIEKFEVPENAIYCMDIFCPGGDGATCGKLHESDLGVPALANEP